MKRIPLIEDIRTVLIVSNKRTKRKESKHSIKVYMIIYSTLLYSTLLYSTLLYSTLSISSYLLSSIFCFFHFFTLSSSPAFLFFNFNIINNNNNPIGYKPCIIRAFPTNAASFLAYEFAKSSLSKLF